MALLQKVCDFVTKAKYEKGKTAFPWSDHATKGYLSWAFSRDYLLLDVRDNEVKGLLIAYPINSVPEPKAEDLFPVDSEHTKDSESHADLCVMDCIFTDEHSRKEVLSQFKDRFKRWNRQDKWMFRHGAPRRISNRYVELTASI